MTCSPPPLLSAWRMEAFSSLLPAYERVVRSSAGKVITLLFSLSSITGSVKPNRQADRAVTGPLIWQLLHITKQRAAITSKWRERGTGGERLTPLLCSAIFAGIFIAPLTRCAPGTFRGSIQVAKGEAWAEGLPSGWVVRVGNLPGGWVCDALRVHDRLFKWICVYVFVLLPGVGGCFEEGLGAYGSVAFPHVWLPVWKKTRDKRYLVEFLVEQWSPNPVSLGLGSCSRAARLW